MRSSVWRKSLWRQEERKSGVLLHFNHIATVSTKWRAQNSFESLTFTSRYMYRLAGEIHQIRQTILNSARRALGHIHNTRHGVKENES
jgi:hypothetical protein